MHPAENSGNWDFRSRKDEKCDGRARFVTHFRYEHLRERFKAYIKYFLFKICDCVEKYLIFFLLIKDNLQIQSRL